ncbi:MAG: hypothetical protein WCR52_11595 [Bacteroidota bacterium]
MQLLRIFLIVLLSTTFCMAQTSTETAAKRVIQTLGKLSLGTSKAEFVRQKPTINRFDDKMGFRLETTETVGIDGLESVTYYFDMDGEQPLYELILAFSTEALRTAVTEKMFGPANYPNKPDHWILGAENGVISIGWSSGPSYSIAANIPFTEWYGDEMFKLPSGFEARKNLPPPTKWPKEDVVSFFADLELQINAGLEQFEKIKGEKVENYFQCTQPIEMAMVSAVIEDADTHKLLVNNLMVADMELEAAGNWKAEMGKTLDGPMPGRYRLKRSDSKKIFGKTADIWNVADVTGKATGVQIGLVVYGETLSGVYVVVLRG